MVFAKLEDLEETLSSSLSTNEKAVAERLLENASSILMSELKRCHRLEQAMDDDDFMSNVSMVCCSMVRRCFDRPDQYDSDSSSQFLSSPVAVTSQHPNTGELFIRGDERTLLGIPKRYQRIGGIGC